MPEAPPLRDDCFAMPQGVDWTPVDTALTHLRDALGVVTSEKVIPVADSAGYILSRECHALRSNPPAANSAVDGFGFAKDSIGPGPQVVPLIAGRAAAGQPHESPVPAGHAIRILTGAILPPGVDTVVLEEDTRSDSGSVAFQNVIRRGANTRRAGEDVEGGTMVFPAGHRLIPPDLALLTALGISEVHVRRRLRVAVLSTGDEIVAPGTGNAAPHQIYDANRPMLLSLLERWGYHAVDLAHVGDDPAALRAALDQGADRADAILTSGGASAGDEDHVSALLSRTGSLQHWRIALKPGRPLALAVWNGVPVFGLPGNPVAAMVCTLIFARPSLRLLAGGEWDMPRGYQVPAAFTKSKKPGRREYLRARLNPACAAEVFPSEGSGRISGLSWAEGLVELGDAAMEVAPGDPVRYIPYGSFDL